MTKEMFYNRYVREYNEAKTLWDLRDIDIQRDYDKHLTDEHLLALQELSGRRFCEIAGIKITRKEVIEEPVKRRKRTWKEAFHRMFIGN